MKTTTTPPLTLNDDQLHTLRHMLGITDPYVREPKPYRDYAAVNPGDPEFAALEQLGAVRRYMRAGIETDYDWYRTTDAGREAALASFRRIRKPRGQRLYRQFLIVRDCDPDLTFRRFLTDCDYRDARARA